MERSVKLSQYYDEQDNCYWMIECYYDDWFCYVIDYSNIGDGNYDLETVYKDIEKDIPNHGLPFQYGYSDEMFIVDYAYYLDFHPVK